jgi:recombination protein RecT
MTDEHLPVVPGTTQQFQKYLFSDELKKKFQMAVPKWLSVDRLLRVVFSSVLKNPKLLQCTTESLMSAIMQCAQLGLEPILGRAHLIPYRNNKKKGKPLECQFQPGYQGLVDLAERSGKIEAVKAHVIYENDEYAITYGLDENLIHKPVSGDRGKPIGAYTVWTRTSGVKTYSFMWLDDIYKAFRSKSEAYRYAVSQNSTNTPWIENESEMMKKSLIKRHSKTEPASIEFMTAVALDNAAEVRETSQVTLLNNLPTGIGEEEDLTDLITQFDASIPPDTNLENLQRFLAVCSKHFDKPVDEIKAEAAKDLETFGTQFRDWEKKEKPTKEDAIRKLYKNLGDKNFRKFVESCKDEIPSYPQINQDEIHIGWKKRFKDEIFPGSPGSEVDAEFEEGKDEKAEEPEDDHQKYLRLVDGAKETTSGPANDCPESDTQMLRTKCEGNCIARPDCSSWSEYDKK